MISPYIFLLHLMSFVQMIPSPDNMMRIRNFNIHNKLFKVATSYDSYNISIFSMVVVTSICRGLYLAYLCSFLPLMNVQHDLTMYSMIPCWLHVVTSTLSMTTWSFLVIFVQHRSILCNEAKASGVWEKCTERNSSPASCSPQSFSSDMLMRTEKAWMPNITYKTGQVVYLEDTTNNRIKGYYKLVSLYDSSSRTCPLNKNIFRVLLDCLLIRETNIEFSSIYRLLIIVLNMICIFEAISAFLLPRGMSFLLTSLVDLVVVFHLSHYFFKYKSYTNIVEGNCRDVIPPLKNSGVEEKCTDINRSVFVDNDSVCSKIKMPFTSSSNKKSIPQKKKR